VCALLAHVIVSKCSRALEPAHPAYTWTGQAYVAVSLTCPPGVHVDQVCQPGVCRCVGYAPSFSPQAVVEGPVTGSTQ
jgi:hypothetical protein